MTEAHPEIGLMLLATAAGLVLWWLGKREPVWRWASLGTLAWGLHGGVWLLERSRGLSGAVQLSDLLLLAGAAAWAVALRGMRPAEPPRLTLALVPLLLAAALAPLYRPDLTPGQFLLLGDLLPVLLALPLLEAALRGQAGEARLVWGLGLLLKAAGSFMLMWLGWPPAGFVYAAWGLGYLLIGWGAYLELRDGRTGRALLGVVLAGLLGSLVLLGAGLAATNHGHAVLTLWVWGYAVLAALGGFGLVVYGRIQNAERRLDLWVRLLESLSAKSQSTQHLAPQGVLESVMEGLKPLFGNLVGLEVRSDVTIRAGQSGPYVHAFELNLENPAEGRLYFSSPPKDARGLEALAPLLTERLRLSVTLNEWRSKAFTDPLTGLLNRRGFERQMQRLIRLAAERGRPITLALLDIDRFKLVNDTHGHPAGDEVLRQLAELLRKASRGEDLVVRMGGEEFGLVLFGAGLEEAHRVLERVRAETRAMSVPPIAWKLTVSGGLAGGEVPTSMATVQRWLEAADQALYEAKQAGRDRVHPALAPAAQPLLQDLLER